MLQKKLSVITKVVILMSVIAGHANAESTISTTITAVSDYVADGVSQSDSKPVLQMGFDYEHGNGFYAGLWGSQIDNDSPATPNMELDYVLGFTKDHSGLFSYDIGITQYTYHHVEDKNSTDYHELFLGLTILKNTGIYYYHADDEAVWKGLQRRVIFTHMQPMTDTISILLLAEHVNLEKDIGQDYNAYQIGIGKLLMDTDLTISYWHNTINDAGGVASNRYVLEISRKFDLANFK